MAAGASLQAKPVPSPPTPEATALAQRRLRLRQYGAAYAFLAPSALAWVVFMVVPIVMAVRFSFQSGGVLGEASWVGLENWRQAFSDPDFRQSIGHTVILAAIIVPVTLILSMLVALALREVRRGASTFRAVIFLPSLAPVVLAALVWLYMVHPDFGLFNIANRAVGARPANFLGDDSLALGTVASLEIWRGIGFWGIFLLAALTAIPEDLYAAAKLDGAKRWRRFRSITLPSIRAPLVIACLLITVFAMQIFDSVYVLTDGGPSGATETAVTYIYRTIFETGNTGYGAVLSLVLLATLALITMALFLVTRARRPHRQGASPRNAEVA